MSGINSISGRSDISQVLAEMRQLRTQMQTNQELTPEISPTQIQGTSSVNQINQVNPAGEIPAFSELLSSAVNEVNSQQMQSSALQRAYERGDPEVSITQVMVQSQKASVAFEALSQVRNKVVKAYEDVMKMPI